MLYGILVAAKFQDRSAHARQRAAMLATALKCRTLEIFSVISPARKNRLASVSTRPVASAEPAHPRGDDDIRCAVTLGFGALATETIARVTETAPRLVVMSWQAHGWLRASRHAIVAGKIARLSKQPVLVVRNAPLRHYQRVLIPTDFSGASMRATQVAMRLLPGTHFTFLHALRMHGEGQMRLAGVADDVIEQCRENAGRAAYAAFSHFIEKLGPQTARVSLVLTSRPERISICAYANAATPDLIVLSVHQRCVLDDSLPKTSVHEVFVKTPCDVLLIGPSCILMTDNPKDRVPVTGQARDLDWLAAECFNSGQGNRPEGE